MSEVLEELGSLLWGWGTLLLIFGVGVAYTVGTGFLPVTRGWRVLRVTVGSLSKPREGISPFAAMAAALGGTMGVGNIVGVAIALALGGAGAIFWMWLGAFAGMMTKYAEVLLAVKYRYTVKKADGGVVCQGGPMYYMSKGIGGLGGKGLAAIFCAACVVGSLGTGNMAQTNAIARCLDKAYGIPICGTGFVITGLTALVILGGAERIVKVASGVVPLMALLYMVGAGVVLWEYRGNIPEAFGAIFTEAFRLSAAGGGLTGLFASRALRIGISRGISTNEAGLGSAPIAHACSPCATPVEQGMWGIVEVFADTVLVCTVTGVAILATGVPLNEDATTAAFGLVWGDWGAKIIAIAITFFAIASVFSWSMYGQQALGYLFPGKAGAVKWYNRIYLLGCFIGCITNIQVVWLAADVLNALMLLPNLIALILLYPEVLRTTEQYWQSDRGHRKKRDRLFLDEGMGRSAMGCSSKKVGGS